MDKIQEAALPPFDGKAPLSSATSNPLARTLRNAYISFSERREALGLSNPGTVDGIAREVQRDVLLNNMMFSGLRADVTKMFSSTPLFQTAHSFTMGTQGMPPYNFSALYGSSATFLQASMDNDFSLSARANYRWTSGFITKANIQLAPGGGQSMVQIEGDYTGADFSANLKAMNPSVLEGPLTGMFVGDYLQAITPNLSLGVEAMMQRTSAEEGPTTMLAYAARYKSKDWVASGQFLGSGAISTSYWRRLSDRVEAGVDLNLQFAGLSGAGGGMMGQMGNEGSATLGAKYEFRTAVFRGQVDSKGKVSCVLDKTVSQPVSLSFAGELDHAKNTAKVGLGISLQSADEEFVEIQEKQGQNAPAAPPPPF